MGSFRRLIREQCLKKFGDQERNERQREYETVVLVRTCNVGCLGLGRGGGIGMEDVGMSNISGQLQPQHLITRCMLETV